MHFASDAFLETPFNVLEKCRKAEAALLSRELDPQYRVNHP